MEALIEAEMETLESESGEQKPRYRFNDDDDDRTSIDMEYGGGDDSAVLDESDEKLLLYRQLTFANMIHS